MRQVMRVCCLAALSLATWHCGDATQTLLVEQRSPQSIGGRLLLENRTLEFSSAASAELTGRVVLRADGLEYDVDYDYDVGRVIADGHGRGLERGTQRLLSGASRQLTEYLGPDRMDLPFQERMLFAAVVLWQESGGMLLDRMQFDLRPEQVEKSVEDDGVRCVQNGLAYPASFDYGETVVFDRLVTAGEEDCNGMCGPNCTQLQPWSMWTLDCLEHDECCRDTSSDTCWTPLGECGDEYAFAEGDFLRGFDPFRRHCGG